MRNTVIDLLRHGEPQGGKAYRGHSIDDPLSEKGWQQMRRAVAGNPRWQAIISSPMQRCVEFAQRLSDELGVPLQLEERLVEVGFGDWEGKTPEQIQQENPAQYEAFYQDPVNARPPGAEPLDQFFHRVTTAYDEICQRHRGQKVLIVAHAGVNRAIITHVLKAPLVTMYRLKIVNAGISRIEYGDQGGQLSRHNTRIAEIDP